MSAVGDFFTIVVLGKPKGNPINPHDYHNFSIYDPKHHDIESVGFNHNEPDMSRAAQADLSYVTMADIPAANLQKMQMMIRAQHKISQSKSKTSMTHTSSLHRLPV